MARTNKGSRGSRARAARGVDAPVELVWPGKRTEPLVRDLLSEDDMQLIERVVPLREPQDDDGQALLPMSLAEGGWRNLLVQGDNLLALHALRRRFSASINLIYIDPPYATGLSYFTLTHVGTAGAGAIERRAYRDQPLGGLAGYLGYMRDRLQLMHELLAPDGNLFLHCDWRASSALRLVLDELFGSDCFRNEIIWRRAPNLGRQAASKQLGRVFDSIFVYSKTPGSPFPAPVPRRRTELPLDGKGKPKGSRWDEEQKCYFTTAPRGDYTDKSIAQLRKQGRVYDSSSGTVYIKYFLTRGSDGRWYKEQPVDALWDDFAVRPLRHRPKAEDMGYDTQKPEGLLERIIGWATRPGDLVADFYCGSGTTIAVAESMARRWIGCDVGRAAIDICRRRLLEVGPRPPEGSGAPGSFEIRSLERAERGFWRDALDCDDASNAKMEVDAAAVLSAFEADALTERWGERDGARVWVGQLDQPVTAQDIEAVCRVARDAGASELVVLGWEWAGDDLAALRSRLEDEHGVAVTARTIPMELTRNAGGRATLHFAERAEVDLEVVREHDSRQLRVRLKAVRCPSPPEARREPEGELGWSELVDAWMVEWECSGDGLEPVWRSYRTRADRDIELTTPVHRVGGDGTAQIRVVVLTVYGEAIARTLRIEC